MIVQAMINFVATLFIIYSRYADSNKTEIQTIADEPYCTK